jgi:hypothetical protein
MAKSSVPLTVLPRIPHAVAFDRTRLDQDVATFAREYLLQSGDLKDKTGRAQVAAVRKLTKLATPEFERLITLHGPHVRTVDAMIVIDKAQFAMQATKTSRRSLWVSGGIFLGALLGFAAAGYGIGLGFKSLFSPAMAEGIQAGWNPIWYTVGGALVGACTGLFIDKLTSPTRAFITRTGYKGAPVQPGDISALTREFIFTNEVEGIVDGRFNGGRWGLTTFEILNEPSFKTAAEELRAARKAADPKEKQEQIEYAATFLSGRLINDELYWFAFDPSNVEMFEYLRMILGAHFPRFGADEIAAFRKAVIDDVRRKRKMVDTRTPTEEAITKYFDPFLERILVPPKGATGQPPVLTVESLAAPVAHAG